MGGRAILGELVEEPVAGDRISHGRGNDELND